VWRGRTRLWPLSRQSFPNANSAEITANGSVAKFLVFGGSRDAAEVADGRGGALDDVKSVHFPKEAVFYAVFFYMRYSGS